MDYGSLAVECNIWTPRLCRRVRHSDRGHLAKESERVLRAHENRGLYPPQLHLRTVARILKKISIRVCTSSAAVN